MGREYVTQLLDRSVAKVYAAARDARSIGAEEILADELTRKVRARLGKPIHERSVG
jgi:hypothetical protein